VRARESCVSLKAISLMALARPLRRFKKLANFFLQICNFLKRPIVELPLLLLLPQPPGGCVLFAAVGARPRQVGTIYLT
jgi:hypothetical protein